MKARLFLVVIAALTISLSGCADLRVTGAADKGDAIPDPAQTAPMRQSAAKGAAASPSVMTGEASGVVAGVATDMPLSIVITMAVPAGIPVSFAPEVDRSTTVNWENKPGEDWKRSLVAALAPAGLEARFADGVVTIMPPPPKWEMTKGLQLEAVLRQWCAKAGIDVCAGVVWKNSYHYPIEVTGAIEGVFHHAVEVALRGFKTAPHPPKAKMHSNKVLVVYASDDKGG